MKNLDDKRTDRQLKILNFEVMPDQVKTVKLFLNRMYWNFQCSENNTITCIGGKPYDLNKVIIEKDGTYHIIGV